MRLIASDTYEFGRVLWDYCRLNETLEPASFILALGNPHMEQVARKSAQLYKAGYGKFIVASGGVKRRVHYKGQQIKHDEADILALYLKDFGVPDHAILRDKKARTTGGNFIETLKLLEEMGRPERDCIAVTIPFVERRARATVDKQTPKLKTQITSFDESYDDFMARHDYRGQRITINILVGTVNRIQDYPHLGYQTDQIIPDYITHAKQQLNDRGYKGDYVRFSELCRKSFKKRKPNCCPQSKPCIKPR